MSTVRVTLPIYGLPCGGALSVEHSLARTPGVVRAYVNPLTEMAYVEYDPERIGPNQLRLAVETVGCRAGEPNRR